MTMQINFDRLLGVILMALSASLTLIGFLAIIF